MVEIKAPPVSVIIPFYNAENYLFDTLNSVLTQSHHDFELILVDDGSTDASTQICHKLSDPRVTIVRQSNTGVSAARNTGLLRARGTIIGFIDSDDLWHPDKIAAHVAHFKQNQTLGVSYSSCRFIDKDGLELNTGYRPKLNGITADDVYCRNPIAGGSSAFFRREIFQHIIEPQSGDGQINYFDVAASGPGIGHGEDHQCWLRMAIKSHLKFGGIDRELTYYRIHDQGLSAKIDQMYLGWQQIDGYVARIAPELHKTHSAIANAYQMRYFARRLIARGEAKQAFTFIRRSLGYSRKPFFQEPRKSLSTIAAAALLVLLPSVASILLRANNPKDKP